MAPSSQIVDRLRKRDALVGVIGLGYVGLPLSVEFGRAGLHAIGFDVDSGKVDKLAAVGVVALAPRGAGLRTRRAGQEASPDFPRPDSSVAGPAP